MDQFYAEIDRLIEHATKALPLAGQVEWLGYIAEQAEQKRQEILADCAIDPDEFGGE